MCYLEHVLPVGLVHAGLDLHEQHLQRVRVHAVVEGLLDGVAPRIAALRPRVPPVHPLQRPASRCEAMSFWEDAVAHRAVSGRSVGLHMTRPVQ